MNSGTLVTANLTLTLLAQAGETMSVDARFSYTKNDPYAVRIAFNVGLDTPVTWVFSRELLSAGLDGPQGLGDVRVWPTMPAKARIPGAELRLSISSPYGRANFKVPAPEIDAFIRRTYEAVPAGAESRYIDIDTELAELLPEVP